MRKKGNYVPSQEPKRQPRPLQADEQKIYGVHAAHALFAQRPDAIVRAYLTKDGLKLHGDLVKWCARYKRAYHLVEAADLEKISASVHHEGIVLLVKRKPRWNDAALVAHAEKAPKRDVILLFDGVQNPHNIGAILRSAAHFGASAVAGARGDLPDMTPAAMRIAEGGAEHVAMAELFAPEATLKEMKILGYRLVATSSHTGTPLYGKPLPARCIIMLGGEVHGMTRRMFALADETRAVPGTGKVESLNVGVAAGVLLAEFWRNGQVT